MRIDKNRITLVIGLLLTVAVLAVVFISMQSARNTEPKISVDSENLVIEGTFGVKQPLNGITKVELKDEAPVVSTKTNGLGIGDIMRGSFDVQGLGNGKLYVHLEQKPFIYITTDKSFIIINFKDSAGTNKLYDDLTKVLKQ